MPHTPYVTLRKAFHNPTVDAEALYRERFSAPNTIHLNLDVSGYPAFCVMDDSIYIKMLELAKDDKKILALTQALPGRALRQFAESTLIDEIVQTNGIEGVNSSRKQIGDILRNLEKRNKRQRFYGLVTKYALLGQRVDIPLSAPKDIRALYDDLVSDEVKVSHANANYLPDGELFRKSQVSVYNAAGQEIHQGLQPESRINEYLQVSLAFLDRSDVELPIKAAIFHYLVGYIHPFYDGNGRLNRFISSYLLLQEYEALVGFRLSYAITQTIERYYKGFTTCNDPLNRGDLTPFVLMFLDMLKQATADIIATLAEKKALLEENHERLALVREIAGDSELYEVASILLQARMFSGDGITIKELMDMLGITRPTVMKRLNGIAAIGLLQKERIGREVHCQLDLRALDRVARSG
jgi:Fic family protein